MIRLERIKNFYRLLDGNNFVAGFHRLVEAAAVARYINGGSMTDAERDYACALMQKGEKDHADE